MTFGEMTDIDSANTEKTSITPPALLEVGAEVQEAMNKLEKFSIHNFLDVLWEGIRHVQILADESNLEIPFLKELPAVVKVSLVYFLLQQIKTPSFLIKEKAKQRSEDIQAKASSGN